MPTQSIRYLDALRKRHGMTNQHFRRIHHFLQNASMATHRRYCARVAGFRGSMNPKVRERMAIILDEFKRKETSIPTAAQWDAAIKKALRKYPNP